MAEIVQLGSQTGRLCGELAAALAIALTEDDSLAGRRGAKFFHGFDADLEMAHHALVSVGVLAPSPDGPSPMPPEAWHYELAVDAADMPDRLAVTIPDGDGRLSVMLDVFVRVASRHFGLPVHLQSFASHEPFARAMVALVRAGYARKDGEMYRWTNRIGLSMRNARLSGTL